MRLTQNTQTGTYRTSNRRRTAALIASGGALAVVLVAATASPASAVPPYEPGESNHEYPSPDQAGYDDPPDGASPTPVPEHPPIDGDSCPTSYDENLDTDVLKLLDQGIDFGDDTWFLGAPLGLASVQWSVDCGLYSADVTGTLHLDGESGRSGRVHVSFWNADGLMETVHSRTRTAADNGHWSWSVNLSPTVDVHIIEVHVCTEISDDGVHFDTVSCKTRLAG